MTEREVLVGVVQRRETGPQKAVEEDTELVSSSPTDTEEYTSSTDSKGRRGGLLTWFSSRGNPDEASSE
ncbi:hypothetical protein DPEC_G00146290 [Dallia pectoralis]|uniref:Uncharacterized protein n=1 Tax=Dallia pectoralis TaxID=75939 RepID=A0ACC2GPS5_DALPE|nr:hypothetical protein DPEC_G00146290 [Dallia pectoralis]